MLALCTRTTKRAIITVTVTQLVKATPFVKVTQFARRDYHTSRESEARATGRDTTELLKMPQTQSQPQSAAAWSPARYGGHFGDERTRPGVELIQRAIAAIHATSSAADSTTNNNNND